MLETKDRLLEHKDILRLLGVPEHMFQLWVRMALIPAPEPYRREEVKFSKRFYYPDEALRLGRKIMDMRVAGLSYRQIRARLAEEVKK